MLPIKKSVATLYHRMINEAFRINWISRFYSQEETHLSKNRHFQNIGYQRLLRYLLFYHESNFRKKIVSRTKCIFVKLFYETLSFIFD